MKCIWQKLIVNILGYACKEEFSKFRWLIGLNADLLFYESGKSMNWQNMIQRICKTTIKMLSELIHKIANYNFDY